MPRIILLLTLVCWSLNSVIAQESYLISYEKVSSYNQEELKGLWKKMHIKEFISPISYSVDVYEVLYWSHWHDGSRVKASGLYYVPTGMEEPAATIVMNHGTKLDRERDVRLGGLQAVSTSYATDGYLVLFPDYIGLGKGDKFHLYHHAETEAMSNIDMLYAVRELNQLIAAKASDQLFITGYSQGGHVAMATHKMIQEQFSNDFTVTASSPMSGAYDLTGVMSEVMYKEYSHPGYLPFLLMSMNEAYSLLQEDVYQIFKSPYDTVIKTMLNGDNKLKHLNPHLPKRPVDMIQESFMSEFENNPEFTFKKALEKNNLYNWKPEAPVQLCYCNADEQVSYKNAFVARDAMKELGAKNVTVRQGGKKYGHNKCALFTAIYTKYYFDSFRKGSKKGKKGPVFKRFLISLAKLKIKP